MPLYTQVTQPTTAAEVINRARAVSRRRREMSRRPVATPIEPAIEPARVIVTPKQLSKEWRLAQWHADLTHAMDVAIYQLFEVPKQQWTKHRQKSLAEIAQEVCQKHEVTMEDLTGERRYSRYIDARREFSYRARTETDSSLPQIGRFLGGKDHTTILHHVRTYEARLPMQQLREAGQMELPI